MTKPARGEPTDDIREQLDRIERMVGELVARAKPKAQPRRRRVERARGELVALHRPTELDRAAARKALNRYR